MILSPFHYYMIFNGLLFIKTHSSKFHSKLFATILGMKFEYLVLVALSSIVYDYCFGLDRSDVCFNDVGFDQTSTVPFTNEQISMMTDDLNSFSGLFFVDFGHFHHHLEFPGFYFSSRIFKLYIRK
jgi:hypothetical protein